MAIEKNEDLRPRLLILDIETSGLKVFELLRSIPPLIEIPLVIGRDRSGSPFVLRDACPHRGMPLNGGSFDGKNLECPYHGWQFDVHNGQCQLIPSLTHDQTLKIDRIYAGSYPCEERD